MIKTILQKLIWEALNELRDIESNQEFTIPYTSIAKKVNCDISYVRNFKDDLITHSILEPVSNRGRGKFILKKQPYISDNLELGEYDPYFPEPIEHELLNPIDKLLILRDGLVPDAIRAWFHCLENKKLDTFRAFVKLNESGLKEEDKDFLRYMYKDLKNQIDEVSVDWLD